MSISKILITLGLILVIVGLLWAWITKMGCHESTPAQGDKAPSPP
jgi:hypothetical protein